MHRPVPPIASVEHVPGAPWSTWAFDHMELCDEFAPADIAELVAVVLDAEARSSPTRLHACGTQWSFTDAAMTDHVMVLPRNLQRIFPTDLRPVMKPGTSAEDLRLVESGIQLFRLNRELFAQGLMLPTLGGSQGQTLGGVVSTGVHGSDIDRPPVADAVVAIHLVAPGGQEYWIERSPPNDVSRGDPELAALPHWHGSILVRRDDDLFHAALVAAGRMGIVYAYVVRARRHRYLVKEVEEQAWSVARANLTLAAQRRSLDTLYGSCTTLPGQTDAIPRFLKVDVDPYGGGGYVARIWETDQPRENPLDPTLETAEQTASNVSTAAWFSSHTWLLPLAAAGVGGAIGSAVAGPIGALVGAAIAGGANAHSGDDIFAHIARDQFRARVTADHGVHDRSYHVLSGRSDPFATYEEQFDDYQQHFPRVDAAEYFFDAYQTQYLAFVDAVMQAWQGGNLGGYISIRFTPSSEALLGMQRWEMTAAVEVAVIHGFRDSSAVFEKVIEFGRQYRGIPHWGQEGTLTAPMVQRIYRERTSRWRRTLEETSRSVTFSNTFSRRLGLEPSPALALLRGNPHVWVGIGEDWNGEVFFHEPAVLTVAGVDIPAELGLTPRASDGGFVFRSPEGTFEVPQTPQPLSIRSWSLGDAPPSGSLVFSRRGKTMAYLSRGGVIHCRRPPNGHM